MHTVWGLLSVMVLVSVAHGDIVDGANALRDSLRNWEQHAPEVQHIAGHSTATAALCDTLSDAGRHRLRCTIPPLFEQRFKSHYTIADYASPQPYYSIDSDWIDGVWTIDDIPIHGIEEGSTDEPLRAHVLQRLTQLRLLGVAFDLAVPAADSALVALRLIGRDIDHFSYTHSSFMQVLRVLSFHMSIHAFLTEVISADDETVLKWALFLRSEQSPSQHLVLIEEHAKRKDQHLVVSTLDARLMPGIRLDNIDQLFAIPNTNRSNATWTIEVKQRNTP